MECKSTSFVECLEVDQFQQLILNDVFACFYSKSEFAILRNNILHLKVDLDTLKTCSFLSLNHLCCVLEDGALTVWNIEAKTQNERTIEPLHNSKVSASNFHNNLLSILFADSVLVVVELENIYSFLGGERSELRVKKWKFGAKINDFYPLQPRVTSCISPALYCRQSELHGNAYLCVGNAPTVGIYWTELWKKKPTLADAYAFVDSALSSARQLIARRETSLKRSRPSPIAASELPLVQHFNDAQRIGLKICDVHGRFALIKDNLGRFLLFDIKGCIVLRVWKGFRESDGFFLLDRNNQLYCAILSRLRKIVSYWKLFDEEMHLFEQEELRIENLQQIPNKPDSFFDFKSRQLLTFNLT